MGTTKVTGYFFLFGERDGKKRQSRVSMGMFVADKHIDRQAIVFLARARFLFLALDECFCYTFATPGLKKTAW